MGDNEVDAGGAKAFPNRIPRFIHDNVEKQKRQEQAPANRLPQREHRAPRIGWLRAVLGANYAILSAESLLPGVAAAGTFFGAGA